jgi:hypothetical protein
VSDEPGPYRTPSPRPPLPPRHAPYPPPEDETRKRRGDYNYIGGALVVGMGIAAIAFLRHGDPMGVFLVVIGVPVSIWISMQLSPGCEKCGAHSWTLDRVSVDGIDMTRRQGESRCAKCGHPRDLPEP